MTMNPCVFPPVVYPLNLSMENVLKKERKRIKMFFFIKCHVHQDVFMVTAPILLWLLLHNYSLLLPVACAQLSSF